MLDGGDAGTRVNGVADGPADHQVVGAVGDGPAGRGDALLVARVAAGRADARGDHDEVAAQPAAQELRLAGGADHAVAAEAEHALGPLQHQVVHRTGTAQFRHLARAEAGEHGHRQDAHAGVRGQGRLHHRRIAVHGGKGDAAAGELLHRQPHRGRDVVQLEVEHHLAAAADDVVHHRPAAGKEQLQADLEEADPFGQPVDQGQGRGRVGQVEGEDDALLQGNGGACSCLDPLLGEHVVGEIEHELALRRGGPGDAGAVHVAGAAHEQLETHGILFEHDRAVERAAVLVALLLRPEQVVRHGQEEDALQAAGLEGPFQVAVRGCRVRERKARRSCTVAGESPRLPVGAGYYKVFRRQRGQVAALGA